MRYQTKEACSRIAILYLPLVAEMVVESVRLSLLQFNNVDRKELLAMLMSLMGDMTSRILRDCIRQLCQPNSVCGTNYVRTSPKTSSPGDRDKEKDREASPLPVMRLLLLLHLSLDTFEYPETVRKDRADTDADNHLSVYKQVACPSVVTMSPEILPMDYIETQSATSEVVKRNSGRMSSIQLKTRSVSGDRDNSASAGALLDRFAPTLFLDLVLIRTIFFTFLLIILIILSLFSFIFIFSFFFFFSSSFFFFSLFFSLLFPFLSSFLFYRLNCFERLEEK